MNKKLEHISREQISKKFAEAGVKLVWETGEPVSIVGTRRNGGDSLPKAVPKKAPKQGV